MKYRTNYRRIGWRWSCRLKCWLMRNRMTDLTSTRPDRTENTLKSTVVIRKLRASPIAVHADEHHCFPNYEKGSVRSTSANAGTSCSSTASKASDKTSSSMYNTNFDTPSVRLRTSAFCSAYHVPTLLTIAVYQFCTTNFLVTTFLTILSSSSLVCIVFSCRSFLPRPGLHMLTSLRLPSTFN